MTGNPKEFQATIGKSGIFVTAAGPPPPGRIVYIISMAWHSIMRYKEQKGIAKAPVKNGANIPY